MDVDMQCVLLQCCQFFNDNMKDLPKSAEYIRTKLCLEDPESCNRFRIYQEFGGENIPPYLDPIDSEQVKKAARCLRNKKE